jgi:hypothetical protein
MSFRAESATAPNRSVFHGGMQYPTHHTQVSQKGVFDIFLRILKPTSVSLPRRRLGEG